MLPTLIPGSISVIPFETTIKDTVNRLLEIEQEVSK